MSKEEETPTVTIWTDPDRAQLVGEVLQQMGPGVQPICVGGPRMAPVDQLARDLNCPHADDPRKMLREWPSRYVLVASMEGIDREDLLTSHGATVLMLEPMASDFDHLPPPSPHRGSTGGVGHGVFSSPVKAAGDPTATPEGRLVFVPAFEASPGWQAAADPGDVLGEVQTIVFGSFGQPTDGSLFARLYDAWGTIIDHAGLPQQVHAALTGPLGNVPDDPRGMTGHLGAHATLEDGCQALVQVSDRAGRFGRFLHMVGNQGHLRMDDTGYRLDDATGQTLDRVAGDPDPPNYARLIALQWSKLLQRPTGTTQAKPLAREAELLACCLACLLSARTANPESPRKMLELWWR
jgi:hypothetical protein